MFDQAVGCVFLVEDCEHDVAIFEYAARRMQVPMTLRKHNTGSSALAEINTFNQLAKAQLPTLFVLDIAIADVDGVSLCKRIVEIYAARGAEEPKIIFLTTQPTDQAMAMAKAAGNIDLHCKPTRLADYKNIFQAMFKLAIAGPSTQSLPVAASA